MIRHSLPVLAALLGALLFWAPLPFAGATPAAGAAQAVASFVALGLALVAVREPRHLRPAAAPAAALLALALLGGLQSLSWPPALAGVLSPEHGRLERQARGLLAEGEASGGGENAWPALSLAPSVSRSSALRWASLAAALLAAAAAGRRRRHRRWLAAAVVLAAVLEVLYGARRALAEATTIWGVEVPGVASHLRGTFVNPDHLATYLEMALAVVFAAFWCLLRRARYRGLWEERLLLVVPVALLWLTLFAGLAFTRSRAGLVAALVGVLLQGGLIAAARRDWRLAPAGAVAALASLGVVAAVGAQQAFGRFAATSPYDIAWSARAAVYQACLELWARFPWLGAGLGTFRDAFPLVQPPGLPNVWRHAHSGPLEMLVTTGLLGTLLFLIGLAALVSRLSAVLRAPLRTEHRAAALAALGALTSVLVHEAVDFGLTMPANAFTLAVICGAAAAVPLPRREDTEDLDIAAVTGSARRRAPRR